MHKVVIPDDKLVWVTSDTHYGHRNIIKHCLRPWMTVEEHAQAIGPNAEALRISDETLARHDDGIVALINSCVGEDDVLIHAGDVAWPAKNVHRFRERLNVKRVIVVLGNHDSESEVRKSCECYERVIIGHRKNIAVVDHYPGDGWNHSHHGCWLLFGHVHGLSHTRRMENPSWQFSQDVGVDIHNYMPWSWDRLAALFESRRQKWTDWREAMRSMPAEHKELAHIS